MKLQVCIALFILLLWVAAPVFAQLPPNTSLDATINFNSSGKQKTPASGRRAKKTKPAVTHSLVGVWQADVIEHGIAYRILWRVYSDGTSSYSFTYPNGVTGFGSGWWRYLDQIVYETWRDGGAGAGIIKWIDRNHFQLLILSNQNGGWDTGLKRNYRRIQ